jgi:hypothetical protein
MSRAQGSSLHDSASIRAVCERVQACSTCALHVAFHHNHPCMYTHTKTCTYAYTHPTHTNTDICNDAHYRLAYPTSISKSTDAHTNACRGVVDDAALRAEVVHHGVHHSHTNVHFGE